MSALDTVVKVVDDIPVDWGLRQDATVRCAWCPWTFTGTAADGMVAARAHRESVHGVSPSASRRKRSTRKGAPPQVSEKTLEENVANARANGSAIKHTIEEEAHVGRPKLWTREALLNALREFHREHGRAPTTGELVPPLPNRNQYAREFGGLIAALDEAGVPRPEMFTAPVPVSPPQPEVEVNGVRLSGDDTYLADVTSSTAIPGEKIQELKDLGVVVVAEEQERAATLVGLAAAYQTAAADLDIAQARLNAARSALKEALDREGL